MAGVTGQIYSGQHGCSSCTERYLLQRSPPHAFDTYFSLLAAHFNFWFVAEHIVGKDNSLADTVQLSLNLTLARVCRSQILPGNSRVMRERTTNRSS